MIYYLFAGIIEIFGQGVIKLRIFDFVYQIATVFLIWNFLKNYDRKAAIFGAIVYASSYSAMNFSNTTQVESFAGIPLIIILQILLKADKKIWHFLILGILTGVLFNLKYTLGAVLLGFPLYFMIMGDNFLESLKKNLYISAGFLISLMPLAALFLDEYFREGAANIMSYISAYAAQDITMADFFKTIISKLYQHFIEMFSFLWAFAAFTGIFYLFVTNEKRIANAGIITVILIFMLNISIFVENKLLVYHFIRLYLPLSILAGFGYIFFKRAAFDKINLLKYKSVLAAILIIMIVFFSPLPRWVNTMRIPYYYLTDKSRYISEYTRQGSVAFTYGYQLEVVDYLQKRMNKADKLTVINSGLNIINHHFDVSRISGFAHSCFYLSTVRIEDYRKSFLGDLHESDYLVIQNNDVLTHLFFHDMSSYEAIMKDEEFSKTINNNFKHIKTIADFVIYEKAQGK
ncbi:MAG: ArnT family glycosyltransferase [Candidatus Kapaibacterium sp.]